MIKLIQESSEYLEKLITKTSDRNEQDRIKSEIKRLESAGDGVQDEISKYISASFLTSIPSQDVETLTNALDDILDSINDAAGSYFNYKITNPPPELIEIAEVIGKLGKTFTVKIIDCLQKFEHAHDIYGPVKNLEARADRIKVTDSPRILLRAKSVEELIVAFASILIIRDLEIATNQFEKAAMIIKGVISNSV